MASTGFTIGKFRESAGMKKGVARPNLFSVTLTNVPSSANLPKDHFPFQCKIATIPPSTLGVIEVPYFGRMINIPGNRIFDNLSVTVINDEEYTIRNAIEKWMASYNSHEGNKSSTSGAESKAGIEIKHFDIKGEQSGSWHFVNCFPVSLGEIGLDWGSNDTAEEFSIDFAYDYWHSKGGAQGGGTSLSFSSDTN